MKISRFLDNKTKQVFEISTLQQLEKILDELDDEFCLANMVMNRSTDKTYIRFRKQLDEYIMKFTNEEILNCPKCKPEDIDKNGFCRCEVRNIQYAKYCRENGLCSWMSMNKEEKINEGTN